MTTAVSLTTIVGMSLDTPRPVAPSVDFALVYVALRAIDRTPVGRLADFRDAELLFGLGLEPLLRTYGPFEPRKAAVLAALGAA